MFFCLIFWMMFYMFFLLISKYFWMHGASFGFAIVGSEIAPLVVMAWVLCGSSCMPFWNKRSKFFLTPTVGEDKMFSCVNVDVIMLFQGENRHASTSMWLWCFRRRIAIALCCSVYARSRREWPSRGVEEHFMKFDRIFRTLPFPSYDETTLGYRWFLWLCLRSTNK